MKRAGVASVRRNTPAKPVHGTQAGARAPAQKQRLERQAERAADGMQRGLSGLAAMLTPTRAAGLPDFHHSGQPLPAALRATMETAFGADFSAVRVHSDAAARAYTRARHGDALTAGNHILFADASFTPALLAHELAHTLQQTAVRDAGSGRWQVRAMQGSDRVQFAGEEPVSPLAASAAGEQDYEKLAALHIAAYPDNQLLPQTLATMKKKLAAEDPGAPGSAWDAVDNILLQIASPVTDSREQQRMCLMADWLKSKKRYAGATNLADKLKDYRTAYFDTGIYPALLARDLSWIGAQWAANAFLKDYSPRAFVDTYYDYLFGVTRDIPALGAKGDFQPKVAAFIEGRAKTGEHGELSPAEPVYYAAWTLQQADKFRIDQMQKQVALVAPGMAASRLTPLQRFQLAQKIDEWAQGLSAGKGLEGLAAPVQGLLIEMGAGIRNAATLAVRYWMLVDQAAAALRHGGSVEGLGDLRVIITREVTKPGYVDFQHMVLQGLGNLFALDADGDPIAAADYEKTGKALVTDIRKSTYKNFESKLLKAIKTEKPTRNTPDISEMVAMGIMLDISSTLVQILGEYSRKDDDAYGSEFRYDNKPAPDIRIHHRLVVARFAWNVSTLLGWRDVESLADAVVGARQTKGQHSQLSLIGDWKEEEDVRVSKVMDDFAPQSTLRDWAPLRPIDLHRFYQTEYFTRLNTELESRLAEKTYDLAGRPIVRAANNAAFAGLQRPKRYFFPIDGMDRAIRAEDTQNLGALILAHPKTRALIRKEQGSNDKPPMHLVPDQVDAQQPFIWFFPPFDALIKRFRTPDDNNFNILVHDNAEFAKERGWTPGLPRDMAAVKSLPDSKWLGYFSTELDALTAKGTAGTVAEPIGKVEGAVEKDYQTERDEVIVNLRKASIRDRFERGRGHVIALLSQYSPYHGLDKVLPAAGSVDKVEFSLQVPAAVDSMIRTIVGATEPKWERGLHHAALLLQLAPTLLGKFGERPLVEVAALFVPVIDSAFKVLDSTGTAVEAVLTDTERAEMGWVSKRRAELAELSDKLIKKLSEQQLTYGVMGLKSAEGTQVLKSVGHGFLIKAKEESPFTITDANTGMQNSWKLISVEKNFVYYPALGPKPAELWELNEAGEATASLAMTEKLAVIEINGLLRPLTGNDKGMLEMLSFAVTMEVMKRQLDELAQMLEQFTEITMDVLEMVPGMQPLIAARMVMSIFAFITSPDFAEIKKTVTEDPAKVFEILLGKITQMVEPAALWEMLLFSDSSVLNRLHGKKVEKKMSLKKGGTMARLMKVVDRMFNFSEEVVGDFARYQTWMRWQAERVEVFVQQRPALNTVLHFIALYFDQIVELASKVGEYISADPAHRDEMTKGLTDWPQSIHDMVLRVADLQLPDEVLPMGELVEAMVELIISRLGAKYKMGANVALYLLRLIGKEQEVFNFIAAQIPKQLNPNHYWQEYVKEPVNKKLDKAGTDFARGVFDFMAASLQMIDRLKDQAPRFNDYSKNVDRDFAARRAQEKESTRPQQQPYGWRAGAPARPMTPPQGGGVPLSGTMKRGNEGWFGQDFSHVRLHRDARSFRYTQAASAAAITAGSHIYLGRGVDTGSSLGQHVMRHELAHVTQQTGARPLGRAWSSGATAPRRGVGVNFHSGMEAQAEHAAHRPPAIGSRKGRADLGAQPATLAELSQRFLTKVTSTVEEDSKAALGGVKRLEKMPASVSPKLKGFWETFDKALAGLTSKNKTFIPVIAQVKNHLSETGDTTTGMGKEVKTALQQAVLDSIRETGTEKDEKGVDKPVYKLDKARLEVSFSQRILGISGIDLEVKLEDDKDKDKGPLKVASLELRYVHLAVVHAGSHLWKKLATPIATDDLPIMRGVLYDEGISLGVWESASYDLTSRMRDKVSTLKKLGGGAVISASDLPTVAEYTQTDPAGTKNNIGLRLGIYSDKGGSQTGPGRESHHTSQYLLVEFLSNVAKEPAFPHYATDPDLYPGVVGSKTQIATIQGATTLNVGKQEAGRGGIMPCILLSAVAHHLPGLHMTPDMDDLNAGVHAQAGVVRRRFRSALGAKFDALGGDDRPAAQKVGTLTTKAERQDAIYNAAISTYHSVWNDRMKNGLKLALAGPERAYYNALAEQKHGGHNGERLTPFIAMEVWAKAVAHNNKLMGAEGWK